MISHNHVLAAAAAAAVRQTDRWTDTRPTLYALRYERGEALAYCL